MQESAKATALFDIKAELERRQKMTPEERKAQEALDQQAEQAAQEERRRERVANLELEFYKALNQDVPAMFQGRTVDELRPTESNERALIAARDWLLTAEDNMVAGRGLWFVGPPGCGKTALLTAMLYSLPKRVGLWRNAKQRRLTVRYVNWAHFICDSQLQRLGEVDDLQRSMRNCDVLVLDDIGAERNTAASKALAYSVIDYRYTNRLPVFLASNLDPESLKADVGERVVDRLYSICPERYRRIIAGKSLRRFPDQLELVSQ